MDRLQELLVEMKIPEQRRTDLGWLRRNLPFFDKHPDFMEAWTLLKEEVRKNGDP